MIQRSISHSTERGLAAMSAMSPDWIPPNPEDPQLQFVRPLLGFTKQQLIDTCLENNVPWFEDPSNKDVGLTQRNAIRFLLNKQELVPDHLKHENLVSALEYYQRKKDADTKTAEEVYETLAGKNMPNSMITFKERTGTVLFIEPQWFRSLKREVRSLVLRRIVARILPSTEKSAVSGYSFVPFLKIADKMEADRIGIEQHAIEQFRSLPSTVKKLNVLTFTFSNLSWRLYAVPKNRDSLERAVQPADYISVHEEEKFMYIWEIIRQPIYQHRVSGLYNNKLSRRDTTMLQVRPGSTDRRWALFDNRYWIRAQTVGIESAEQKTDAAIQLVVSYPLSKENDVQVLRDLASESYSFSRGLVDARKLQKKPAPRGKVPKSQQQYYDLQFSEYLVQPLVDIFYNNQRLALGFPMLAMNKVLHIPMKVVLEKLQQLKLEHHPDKKGHSEAWTKQVYEEMQELKNRYGAGVLEIECQLKSDPFC